jgi:hypothetical protein
VDGWIGLLDQSADCPEAEARHGQAGSGLLEWSVEAVDRSGWMDWDLTNLPIVLKP